MHRWAFRRPLLRINFYSDPVERLSEGETSASGYVKQGLQRFSQRRGRESCLGGTLTENLHAEAKTLVILPFSKIEVLPPQLSHSKRWFWS